MISAIKKFNVKENSAFPSFDYFNQLAKEISSDSRVKIFSDGISINGKELKAFAIGTGEKIIGITSGAHSDEPIGVLTQSYFIKGLLGNDSFSDLLKEYTFICHPLVDPDGYELNSTWFSNPLNFKNYWLNNYRNNGPAEDCEHGIPFQDGQKARPEMIFVKNNLDRFKGRFDYYVTLHSSHVLPGACFVFDQNHSDIQIRQRITELCHSYDLSLMDYKSRGDDTLTYLGPGFIGAPNVASYLDQYKNHPEILEQIKMTTYEYAQTYCGAKSAFISELPIWIVQGMDDYSDSSMTMNEFKKITLERKKIYLEELNEIEKQIIKYSPKSDNPWFKSLQVALKMAPSALQDDESKIGSYEGHAQVLEVKELENQSDEYKCKVLKYAIKSLEDLPGTEDVLLDYRNRFDDAFQVYESKMRLKQLPLKVQVEIQIGLIFSGIPHFNKGN